MMPIYVGQVSQCLIDDEMTDLESATRYQTNDKQVFKKLLELQIQTGDTLHLRGAFPELEKSDERIETAKKIWEILIDQQYGIGTVGQSPALMGVRLVSNKLGNIPGRNCIAQHCRTPGGAHPETWFYKE